MLNHIEQRWETWISSCQGRRQVNRWMSEHPHLRTWSAEDLRKPISSRRTDAMQATLVALAQAGDQGAVATLLVQLRPGLLHLVGWMAVGFGRGRERRELEDEVVGVLCETIMKHPLARRPRRIAANLLLDTRQTLWRGGQRDLRTKRAAASMMAVGSDNTCSAAWTEEIVDELAMVDTLADAIESLPGTTASRRLTGELAYRAWILDEARHTIAADVGLPSEVVRARLSRLRSRIDRPDPAQTDAMALSTSETVSGCR